MSEPYGTMWMLSYRRPSLAGRYARDGFESSVRMWGR